jgi:hypothetical protein
MVRHWNTPHLMVEVMSLYLLREMKSNPAVYQLPCPLPPPQDPNAPQGYAEIHPWLKKHTQPQHTCDECGKRHRKDYTRDQWDGLYYHHGFALTREGFVSFWLCEDCGELWEQQETAVATQVIPNVMRKLNEIGLVSLSKLLGKERPLQ